MGVDAQTGRIIVQDSDGVYVVDLSEEDMEISERVSVLPFDQVVDGLVVDSQHRRLYLATSTQGAGATITSVDLDTHAQVGSVVLGNQIHRMALDPRRNRLAVNTRVTTAPDSAVILLDLTDLSVVDYQLSITDGGMLDVDIAIDTTANQLLVSCPDGTNPRVELYELPD
jgi:hypothetical protein